jgi:hypothetical protein
VDGLCMSVCLGWGVWVEGGGMDMFVCVVCPGMESILPPH